jgi:phage terminase large subunit
VFLDAEIIEMWESEYTGDFARQELGGEFVAFEGLIYAEFEPGRHVSRERPDTFARVIAGVDWGFANPGVIVVLGVDGDGRAWVLAEVYERRRRVEEWVEMAAQMRDLWGISGFYCDPSEPEYIKAFRERGLKAEGADNAVLPGIQAVKNALAQRGDGTVGLTISPDCVHLLSEFEQYQWAENRHGIKDEPVKANDHAMDAMRYAIMAAGARRRNFKTTVEAGRYA